MNQRKLKKMRSVWFWAIGPSHFFKYWSCWLLTCMDHKRHHDNLNHALDDFIILWYFVPLWKYYLFVSTGIRCHFFHSSIHLLKLANVHKSTAAVAQSVRAFISLAECWMFEFKPRQTYGRTSSTAQSSATCVSVPRHRNWPFLMVAPCHSRFCTLKNLHYSISTEHRSNTLRQLWWRLHVGEKLSRGAENR